MAKTKEVEVGFSDLELTIERPVLNESGLMCINGNFTELGKNIKNLVEKYKGVELTDENVKYVTSLKGQFVSLRTGIDKERKAYLKSYIDPAKSLINDMCDELQKIVAEGESALASQLEAYDQKRKDELTLILNEYVQDAVSNHNLREEFACQIVLRDKYYNKTQDEEASADDIEAQAVELEKKQKEYDAGVQLITAECEDAGFLPDSYIRELKYKSAMEIILEIKSDKNTAKELQEKMDNGEKVTLGEPTEEFETKLKEDSVVEEKRERVLRVRYTVSQAKLMSDFFKKNKIEFEFVKL